MHVIGLTGIDLGLRFNWTHWAYLRLLEFAGTYLDVWRLTWTLLGSWIPLGSVWLCLDAHGLAST